MNENDDEKIEVYDVDVSLGSGETIPPPPPGFTSPFQTVQEWLFHICDTNEPEDPFLEYQIQLFEMPDKNLLSLIGYSHSMEQGVSTSRVHFKPVEYAFIDLPQEEFQNLVQQQIYEKLFHIFQEFLKTEKFRQSFLSKGTIKINTGLKIWP